jgi:integrase/recombinase XerC
VNILVRTAVHLVSHPALPSEALGCCTLPAGFLFLVDDDSGRVVEPVLLYLADRYIGKKGMARPTSLRAAVYNLKDWWAFLAEFGKRWNDVSTDDLRFYRDAMLQTVSPKTHQPYDVGTVRRRLSTVLQFYRWAWREGFFEETLNAQSIRQIARSLDRDALAHLHSNAGPVAVSDLLPRPRRGIDDAVRPFTETEYRTVAHLLGPLPPEEGKPATDGRPTRNRLIAEVSVHTGMRRDEISALTLWQILDLHPDPSRLFQPVKLRITQTKGLRPRHVFIPSWLVTALLWYIDHERKVVLQAAKAHWLKGKVKEPTAVFLNGPETGRHAGKPIQNGTIDAHFRRAVIAAGLTHSVHKTQPETGEHYVGQEPSHVFHDLRHTFATWLYWFEKSQGNPEPWKKIQARLGHAELATTTGLYLRAAADFEAQVSDTTMKFFEALRHD